MIEKFEGVTVLTKANVYFDGKVQSRTVLFADGSKKTLGVILPGEYEFGTADRELMEMTAGVASVVLPGREDWQSYGPGQSFGIPRTAVQVPLDEPTEYVCTYFRLIPLHLVHTEILTARKRIPSRRVVLPGSPRHAVGRLCSVCCGRTRRSVSQDLTYTTST